MSAYQTPTGGKTDMTEGEISERILILLAEEMNQPLEAARAEIEQNGPEWVADSVQLLEVLLRLEDEFGFEAPHDVRTAQALTSVSSLARYVLELAPRPESLVGHL
jgi:acyl carrier protein